MSISLGSDRLGLFSLLHQWQKEEVERHKKEEGDCARSSLQRCWSPLFGRLFSTFFDECMPVRLSILFFYIGLALRFGIA
jgi:hypothetical protein